jgi:hypothetical protein
MAGFCEHGNEHLGCLKHEKFLDQVSYYQCSELTRLNNFDLILRAIKSQILTIVRLCNNFHISTLFYVNILQNFVFSISVIYCRQDIFENIKHLILLYEYIHGDDMDTRISVL